MIALNDIHRTLFNQKIFPVSQTLGISLLLLILLVSESGFAANINLND